MSIRIEWGYDRHTIPAFTGVVKKARRAAYPLGWTLDIVDSLWLADINKEDINLLNDKTAKEVVETLLRDYGGVSRLDIATLPASGSEWAGSEWMLGTLTPIAFSGTTALQAASSICSVLGYWLFCDASGTARAVFMDGRPSASPFRTFVQGTDLLVEGAPEREQDADAIYNRVIVLGANTGIEGAQIKDQWRTEHVLLPSGKYREFSYSSSLIEYINESEAGAASATAVAKRLLAVKARQPNAIRGRIKADPRLQVGMTLGIKSSRIGYGGTANFFLYSVQTTFGGGSFDQQLVLDGGLGDQGYTTIPPPLASFTFTLFRETLDGVDTIEVFVDGSSSVSLTGGEIVAWAWSDDTTPTAQTGTGVRFVFFYPATQVSAEITLTVTDTSSKTGSTTQTITLLGDALQIPAKRQISFAAGAAWYVTPDSGATWRKETTQGDAIATPPIGSGAAASTGAAVDAANAVGLFATAGSGGVRVRTSTDFLLSPSTQLDTQPAPNTFLWQNETDPLRLWAASGDGVYRSIDGGVTFILAGTPATGQDVAWVLESADQLSVEALAGPDAYWSYSSGASWAQVLAGPLGSIARCYASGFATHWVGFTGVSTGESPLMSVEGVVATFPPVTPEVLDIRALTMLVNEPTLYAFDDQGRTWRIDAATGTVQACAATTGTIPDTTPQHAIRDPEVSLIYLSCNDALRKYFPDPDVLKVFKAVDTVTLEAGMMAGYANIHQRVGVELVVMPTTGGSDLGWHYRDGSWTSFVPPAANKHWYAIEANPFNPDQWLAFGSSSYLFDMAGFYSNGSSVQMRITDATSPLWYSPDAGATWQAVTLPSPTTGYLRLSPALWREDFGGQWFLTSPDEATGHPVAWRRDTAPGRDPWDAVRTQYTNTTNVDMHPSLASGFNGDIIAAALANSLPPTFNVLPPTGTTINERVLGGIATQMGMMDRWPPTLRGAVMVFNSGDLAFTDDYASSIPTTVLAAVSASLVALADGRILLSTPTGVAEVTDIASSPSLTVVADGGGGLDVIHVDRQTRTAAAVMITNSNPATILVYDGTTWAHVEMPAGANPSPYAGLAVIVRTT